MTDSTPNTYHLTGYPSLTQFIASDRDRTTLIFKRFDELAIRNLLLLQSELVELQAKQRTLDFEDFRSDDEAKRCARDLKEFTIASKNPGNTKQRERMDLALQIRQSMKDYREALLLESTLASLPRPSKAVLETFQFMYYNKDKDKSKPFPTLDGNSAGLYDYIDDLVALRIEQEPDRLTSFAQEHMGWLFPDKKRSVNGIAYASDRAIGKFAAWFSTLLAAMLLIGAIVILYKVQNPDWRLGLISAFTSLFAGSVGLLTNARRAELFGATAAYAAVLVVFVSGDLGKVT